MTYELIQLSSSENQPKFGKIAGLTTAVAFVAGWGLSGKMGVGGIWAFVGFVVGSIIWFIKRNNTVYSDAKTDLVSRGYNIDFQVGNALIDSKAKVIAFVDLASRTYDLYSACDILGWEHQWTDKTTASTNAWGDSIRAHTRQASNILVFKTNNLAKPLYKVPLVSHQAGEQWMARLDAIINN